MFNYLGSLDVVKMYYKCLHVYYDFSCGGFLFTYNKLKKGVKRKVDTDISERVEAFRAKLLYTQYSLSHSKDIVYTKFCENNGVAVYVVGYIIDNNIKYFLALGAHMDVRYILHLPDCMRMTYLDCERGLMGQAYFCDIMLLYAMYINKDFSLELLKLAKLRIKDEEGRYFDISPVDGILDAKFY